MILLVAATPQELDFPYDATHIETLICGIGPVEAAIAVARELARTRYRLVINVGIAGALPHCGAVGDAVVVAEELFPLELETGAALSLPPELALATRAQSDPHLVAALQHRGFQAVRGLTVSRVTATEATAERIASHQVGIESMEGYAVLRAAERAGIPAVEVRGISNRVGSREQSGWNFSAGVQASKRILDELLSHLAQDEHHGE